MTHQNSTNIRYRNILEKNDKVLDRKRFLSRGHTWRLPRIPRTISDKIEMVSVTTNESKKAIYDYFIRYIKICLFRMQVSLRVKSYCINFTAHLLFCQLLSYGTRISALYGALV